MFSFSIVYTYSIAVSEWWGKKRDEEIYDIYIYIMMKRKKKHVSIYNKKVQQQIDNKTCKETAAFFLSTVSHTYALRDYMFNIYIYTNIMQ